MRPAAVVDVIVHETLVGGPLSSSASQGSVSRMVDTGYVQYGGDRRGPGGAGGATVAPPCAVSTSTWTGPCSAPTRRC